MSLVGAVPGAADVVPLVKLLSPAVKDVGMKVNDTPPMIGVLWLVDANCSIFFVDAVEVGRERVGNNSLLEGIVMTMRVESRSVSCWLR